MESLVSLHGLLFDVQPYFVAECISRLEGFLICIDNQPLMAPKRKRALAFLSYKTAAVYGAYGVERQVSHI